MDVKKLDLAVGFIELNIIILVLNGLLSQRPRNIEKWSHQFYI